MNKMFDIRIFTLLIVFVSLDHRFVLSDVDADYCYSVDKHPYLYDGTKTPYHFMHGTIKNSTVPNCEPVQIWMLTRHGTRYSGKSEIKKMKKILPDLQHDVVKNHEKHGRGSLCKSDIENLKAWVIDPNLHKRTAKFLTKQGEEDLKSLAARFKIYFPQLLQTQTDDIPENKYKFRSTDIQRTIASMNFFIKGLFGDVFYNNTEVVPIEEDTLLKIYKICKPFVEIDNNASSNVEVNAFLSGPEIEQVVHKVSQRLGFKKDLPFESVLSMYTSCVFERAWYVDKLSPWCAAFTEDSLKVFEYEEDLHYYYHGSYGQPLSAKVGCRPLQDMFQHFSQIETGNAKDEPKGIFYFTHSTMLQLFLSSMGVAKDTTPLKASNYATMGDRKWRTSKLAPFAANFAAILFKCDSSYKVRFYLNEKPLDFEGCELGVCDWNYLKEKLKTPGFGCSIDFCQL